MTAAEVNPPPYARLAAFLPQAPTAAGVYLFQDPGGRVLYVGKAVNLRHRLASYLKSPEKHEPKTALMLRKAGRVDFVITTTEREALILERHLIRQHRPRYNVVLRDDKNFLCLRLDPAEDFPALRFVRRFHPDGALYFGPYTSSAAVRRTVKVIKQVFGLRTCKERRLMQRTRPCLDYQVGKCLAPCTGQVSREDYHQAVQETIQFLKGRGRTLIKRLRAEMEEAAARLDFEKAAARRDRLQAVSATLERQDMARPHFLDQDVLAVAREDGRSLVLVLTVRAGLVSGSQEYYFPEPPAGGDLLGDFLKQYYQGGRPLPDEILLPAEVPDRKLLGDILSEQKGKPVRLVVVGGDEGRRPAQAGKPAPPTSARPPRSSARVTQQERLRLAALAAENARAALQRRREEPAPAEAVDDLAARLKLRERPARLHCLDISTLQGGQSVGALVSFLEGAPEKSAYRRFRIRGVPGQDDFAMLAEVARRHYGKEGQTLPDLLVVDGGKGQLAAVLEALKEVGREGLNVLALAKAAETAAGPVRDRIFLPGRQNPKFLPPAAPGWLLLLRARDEAHRFALSYHRQRARRELAASGLLEIPGIGPARVRRLWERYDNLEALRAAAVEDLAAIPGFTRKAAEAVREWLSRGRGGSPAPPAPG
ncbi:MAG: excinuclease ABC subunit C [Deltaproteobacteria bacterium]|nr:excinuclease ABC subunit C [Deltaproteobacteria bacterium]